VEVGAEREAGGRSGAGARRLGVEGEAGASGPRRSPGDARRQARLESVEKILTRCLIWAAKPIHTQLPSHFCCDLRRVAASAGATAVSFGLTH